MRVLCIAILLVATTARADPKVAADLEVPTVSRGLDPLPAGRPTVLVTTKAIIVDGKPIVAIASGAIDPSEKEGSPGYEKISRLVAYVKKAKAPPSYVLAFDKSLPFRLMTEVMYSIDKAGVGQFDVLAHAKELGVVHVKVPKAGPSTVVIGGMSGPRPVLLAVAVKKDKLVLFSMSGDEGTYVNPKLEVARADTSKIAAALAEIVKTRFATKRVDADRSLIVTSDNQVSIQEVVNLMIATRGEFSEVEVWRSFE